VSLPPFSSFPSFRSDVASVAPRVDKMERTRHRFAALRAWNMQQDLLFGPDRPGISTYRNGADAVRTLYLVG
jgi:hypothetical protein